MLRSASNEQAAATLGRYLFASLPLLVAVLLYGYAAQLPLFLDDGPNLWIAEANEGFRHWDGARSYPYYRPLVFSIWRLSALPSGHYDPVALHLLNVFCFGVSGVLLGVIVRRLAPRPHAHRAGALAGLGFVLFPMSYQAVPFVGAFFHALVALSTLCTIWLALRWLDGGSRWTLMGCWLGAFITAFSHENGVLLPALLLMAVPLAQGRRSLRSRRAQAVLVPVLLIVGVYGLLWLTVPRAPGFGELRAPAEIFQSFGTVLQSLVYPFAALVRPFVTGTATPHFIVALAAVVLVPLAVVLGRQSPAAHRVAAWGLVWFFLGILPQIALLDQHYVSGSPRILMFAALGASIFWSMALVALWDGHPPDSQPTILLAGRRLLVIGIIALAVGVSWRFLTVKRDYYEKQSVYMGRLLDYIEHQPDGTGEGGILLVNAPDYISPLEEDRVFLRGVESVGMMDYRINYGGPNGQIWVNTGLRPDVDAVTYTQSLRASGYSLFPHGDWIEIGQLVERARSSETIYATQFVGDDFWPVYVGGPNIPGPDTPIVTFGDEAISLTQADMVYLPAHQAAVVRARWRVRTPTPAQPFTHVFCGGELVGQLDAAPWGETYPFAYWNPDEIQTEYREVRLSRPFVVDACYAYLGIYYQDNGVRLRAVDAQTGVLLNDLFTVPFRGESDAVFPFAPRTE